MRHRVYGKHLGRDKNQRSALFKSLVRSLILHESITTTESKAKSVKGLVDKLIVKSKAGTNQAKEFVQTVVPDSEVNKKLFTEIAPRYRSRVSGFTNLVKVGRRVGDGAMMVKMSLMAGEKQEPKNAKETAKKKEKVVATKVMKAKTVKKATKREIK